ncbi:helix-turn-helix domain-containing protein [Agrobacterium fabrum]|uniref:helix-turn-helix domain-containing protein n=1 Tax=Agrobacterium fabrum TaxID=1176649 RepID=UPI003BA20213
MKRSSRGVFDIETMRNIGARIRDARGNATQEEFSKKIGVGRTVLANYEAGRRLPDSRTLEKIADESNLTVNFLLSGLEATVDPFQIKEKFSETVYEDGFAAALFIFERMRLAFASKSEVHRLKIWANVVPKLAEHLEIVIGENVAINDSDYTTELQAIIDEFRSAETTDILELIVELNTNNLV